MKASEAQKLRNILAIIGTIIMLGAKLYKPLFIIGAIVTLSAPIPDILYNKCPHCGKRLYRNEGRYCQHCGEKID